MEEAELIRVVYVYNVYTCTRRNRIIRRAPPERVFCCAPKIDIIIASDGVVSCARLIQTYNCVCIHVNIH